MSASVCLRRAALLALLLLAGCKKKRAEPNIAEAFRDAVCRCSDPACVTKVTDDFAKMPMGGTRTSQSAMDQATECIANVNKLFTERAPAQVAGPAMPQQRRQADALISAARKWQQATRPGLAIWELTVNYVDADAMIDAEHGSLTVQFAAINTPADDPNRKTGAPVKPNSAKPTQCPTLTLGSAGWNVVDSSCADIANYIPKCTVEMIRMMAWVFTVVDEPRNVNIAHELADDCERTLEQP